MCEAGSYCTDGIVYTCPAGRYGSTTKLLDNSCSGLCQKGHFCPAGSKSMTEKPCPIGRYGDEKGLKNESCSGRCPLKLDCPLGSVLNQEDNQASMGNVRSNFHFLILFHLHSALLDTVFLSYFYSQQDKNVLFDTVHYRSCLII